MRRREEEFADRGGGQCGAPPTMPLTAKPRWLQLRAKPEHSNMLPMPNFRHVNTGGVAKTFRFSMSSGGDKASRMLGNFFRLLFQMRDAGYFSDTWKVAGVG